MVEVDGFCPRCQRAPAQRYLIGSPRQIRAAVAALARGEPIPPEIPDLRRCDRCQAWADVPRSFVATVTVGRWLVTAVVRAVREEAGWQWRHGGAHRLRVLLGRAPTRLVPFGKQATTWATVLRPESGISVRALRPGARDWRPAHWLVDDVDAEDPEGGEDSGRVVPTPGWRQLTEGLRARGWLRPRSWRQRMAPPDDGPPGDPRLGRWQPHDIRPRAWGPQPVDAPARTPEPESVGEILLRWGRDADDDNGSHRPDPGPDAPWYDRPPYAGDRDFEAGHREHAIWAAEWEALHDEFRRHEDSAEPADAELPPAGRVDAPPPGPPDEVPPHPDRGPIPPLARPLRESPGAEPDRPPMADPPTRRDPTALGPRTADADAEHHPPPGRYRWLDHPNP
jgi:hypothetical protein